MGKESNKAIMKTCELCGTSFEIPQKDRQYFEIHSVNYPKYCRLCSWQNKLRWANEYQVYRRKCDATGKSMISVYKQDAPFPVYEKEYWSGQNWSLPEMDYNENKPFFEQYWKFFKIVPRPSTNRVGAENSEYAHLIFDSKSCYLSFQVFQSERLIGCYRAVRMKDSANCFFCIESELLCECVNCAKCYNVKFSEDTENCSDSAFLYDCKGCRNCFMCWNLRNKEYCFKNEKYSKEEYEKKIAEYDFADLQDQKRAKQDFENQRENFVAKALHMISCENCFGDYLVGCKDCNEIYFSDGCRDSNNVLRGTEDINSFDAVVGGKIELCYNLLQPGWCYKSAFTINCNRCNETYLSESCEDLNDCLGCISLKRGKFSIFNKRYEENEYRRLKDKIFVELREGNGFEEFFDVAKSPFGYSETIADLYFPGLRAVGEDKDFGEGKCSSCGKDLQFSEAEKKFYAKIGMALPDRCFYCLILNLARPYSVVNLEKAQCAGCGQEVFVGKSEMTYKKLYCEQCYLKSVY